jgi:hypothetical protein
MNTNAKINYRNEHYTCIASISEEIYLESESRAAKLPIFANSHRKRNANEIGCLGEVIAEQWMRSNCINYTPNLEETTHDYVVNNQLTIDVKTKDRTVVPKIDYDNSAPFYNHTHQQPDYFFFISLKRDRTNKSDDIRRFYSAYLVGAISYEELDAVGILFRQDEEDWRNGTKFWTDCLNVEVGQLIPLKEIIDIFKGHLDGPSKKAEVNKDIVRHMQKLISDGVYQPRKLPSI